LKNFREYRHGLALVAAVRGYKWFHHHRQAIEEKVDLLKALGAEVIVLSKRGRADDPRS